MKGDKELLTEEFREYFVGIKENQFGFEGLVLDKNKIEKVYNERVLIEKPSLEEIVLYFTRGNGCA